MYLKDDPLCLYHALTTVPCYWLPGPGCITLQRLFNLDHCSSTALLPRAALQAVLASADAYQSVMEVTTSDHKPVYAHLSVTLPVVHQPEQYQQATKRLGVHAHDWLQKLITACCRRALY